MGLIGGAVRVLAGKQGKAAMTAIATGVATQAARTLEARVTASRGEDSVAARMLRKGAKALETTDRVAHARYQFEAENASGGWLGKNLIHTSYVVAREAAGPARQQTIAAPIAGAAPRAGAAPVAAVPDPEAYHAAAQQAENAGDLARAFQLYGAAAMQGYPPAMNDLGYCYETGMGAQQDKAQALRWYRAAAAQGHVNAINNLAALEAEERQQAAAQQRGTVEWARMKLGVGPQAGDADIKAAHLRLISLLHPDRGGFNEDAADLNDARRVLLGR